MPSIIDTQALNVNELPAVWSPVQWDLTEDERVQELESSRRVAASRPPLTPPDMRVRIRRFIK